MKIAVAREIDPAEPRVAASPDTVKKFKALEVEVAVEPGAGVINPVGQSIGSKSRTGSTKLSNGCRKRTDPGSNLASYASVAIVLIVSFPRCFFWSEASGLALGQQRYPFKK